MIRLKDIEYKYENTSSRTTYALKGVSLEVKDGEFWGIIGHTGSGKSTLSEIMSGLLKPDKGFVEIDGEIIKEKKNYLKAFRGKVGMVFQYPEYQLFEETVIKDVCFGPRNLGFSEEECLKKARRAMRLTGLSEDFENLSPFELSGGEKRRVAIAGVIAMEPDVLVLDEPTAGLDPVGRDNLLEMLGNIKGELCKSIVLVSHSMEDVASFCDKVLVLNDGSTVLSGDVREVFKEAETLISVGLDVPQITRLIYRLNKDGYNLDKNIITVDEAVEAIYNKIKEAEKC